MVATEAVDRLQPTAASHDRVMILEVMGRDSGQIALAAGIAGGADVILVPEIPYSIDAVAAHIRKVRDGAHNFAIVVVAEGVRADTGEHVERQHARGHATYGGIGYLLGEALARITGAADRGVDIRKIQRTLGHGQLKTTEAYAKHRKGYTREVADLGNLKLIERRTINNDKVPGP